uniref:Eyes shut (inferred by orthology to a D. melanogaster protein) n=1 Tax=Strongyloides venezuelensis TaxID=75913 RepID=A0A0K0FJP0_STRVS
MKFSIYYTTLLIFLTIQWTIGEPDEIAKEINNEVKKFVTEAGEKVNKEITQKINENTQEPCTSEDCSNNGSCIGTKQQKFCICNLGFAGDDCSERLCDPAVQCNGRGICFGTTKKFTCMCGLGFTGEACEKNVKVSDEKESNKIN